MIKLSIYRAFVLQERILMDGTLVKLGFRP